LNVIEAKARYGKTEEVEIATGVVVDGLRDCFSLFFSFTFEGRGRGVPYMAPYHLLLLHLRSIFLSAKPLYYPSLLLITQQRTVSKLLPTDYTIKNTDIPTILQRYHIKNTNRDIISSPTMQVLRPHVIAPLFCWSEIQ